MNTETKINALMIVDDNAIDQMMCERIARRTGVVETVLGYVYAEEALAYLERAELPVPDLILLDINMPRMDGFEFLEVLSNFPANLQRPTIVMLSTSLDPKDKARAAKFELVQGYLTKPISDEKLKSVIDSLV